MSCVIRDPDEIFGIARSKSKKATKVYFSPQKLQSFTDPPMSQVHITMYIRFYLVSLQMQLHLITGHL